MASEGGTKKAEIDIVVHAVQDLRFGTPNLSRPYNSELHVAGLNLTRQQWQKFKEDNNLSSGSLFKKANVGPLVDAFHEAGKRWDAKDGVTADGRKFLKAAEKLHKAFAKFIRNKEAKGQLSREAYQQMRTWMEDVGDAHDQVADLMKLQSQSGGDKVRDAEIMSKKLDKMFNF